MGTLVVGRAGWVRYEDPIGPGRVYLRFGLNLDERWVMREIFIDSDGQGNLTAGTVGQIPFVALEAMVNNSSRLKKQMEIRSAKASAIGGPQGGSNLAVLASYSDEHFVAADPHENWVAAAYFAELAVEARAAGSPLDGELPRIPKRRLGRIRMTQPSDFRLLHGPGADGLTDAFLHNVARAYTAALERGEAPNKTLASDSSAPIRTVERWVYTARKRRAMAPGRSGSRG